MGTEIGKMQKYLNEQVPELKARVSKDEGIVSVRVDYAIEASVQEFDHPHILLHYLRNQIFQAIGKFTVIAEGLRKPIE